MYINVYLYYTSKNNNIEQRILWHISIVAGQVSKALSYRLLKKLKLVNNFFIAIS